MPKAARTAHSARPRPVNKPPAIPALQPEPMSDPAGRIRKVTAAVLSVRHRQFCR